MKTFTLFKSFLIICVLSLMGGVNCAWAQETVTLASFTNVASTDWEHTAGISTGKTKYFQLLGSDKYVQSPEIDLTNVYALSISINARTYGGESASNIITIQLIPSDGSDYITLGTKTPTTNGNKKYSLEIKNTFHAKGKIRIVALGSTSSKGAGLFSATINEAGTFSITSAGYATYFTDKAFTMPKGVTGSIITDANGGSLTIEDKYPAGSVVPASTALLLKGAEKEYTYNVVTTTETAPTNNLLHGSISEDLTSVNENTDDYLFYKLSYNEAGDQIGFYWAEDKGAYFVTEGGKAYLAVPKSQGASQMKGFALDGTTTSIQQASIADKASSIFDINGRRVSTLNGAAKGVYIVGGKKVMVK